MNTVAVQIGKLAEGVSKEEGKHKRDLLHLSFAALTALAADVKNIPSSSQDALREVMPFLTVKVLLPLFFPFCTCSLFLCHCACVSVPVNAAVVL